MIPCDICAAKDGICPAKASSCILSRQELNINLLFTDKFLALETFSQNLACVFCSNCLLNPYWATIHYNSSLLIPVLESWAGCTTWYYLPSRVFTANLWKIVNLKGKSFFFFSFHSLKALQMTFTCCKHNPLIMCLVLDRWWGSSAWGLRDCANSSLLTHWENVYISSTHRWDRPQRC